jgi:hypothetical protein
VPWRIKLPVIAGVALASVLVAHAFAWPSTLVRAAGIAIVVGWVTWIGDKDAPASRRLAVTLAWMSAAIVASLVLDRLV